MLSPDSDVFAAIQQSTRFRIQPATPQTALGLLETAPPDAVIATSTVQTRQLFIKIQSEKPYPARPLLVMVRDEADVDDEADDADEPADAVLSESYLEAQLATLLKLHTQTRTLHQQQQRQDARIEELEQQLRSERRVKDELEVLKNAIVRNVSHELKTPLLQVKSAVALLEKPASEEEHTKLIELATTATARLELVVRNITMLGGSLESHPGPMILFDAVEAAIRQLRRLWEHRDQTSRIKVEVPQTLPPVLADKQGINIVFQLLLDNALKFSKESGKADICVNAAIGDGIVTVSVKDRGIGIAPDKLESVFDMFYQVDNSSTRRHGGAGVGLTIVRMILENHNSQIRVSSDVGAGSTFSFDLPIAKL
jgi:signal transduction histidine kinase